MGGSDVSPYRPRPKGGAASSFAEMGGTVAKTALEQGREVAAL